MADPRRGSRDGLTLLDLAAAFDASQCRGDRAVSNIERRDDEGRWLAAVRLPDGIDAPDIGGEPVDAAAVLAEIVAEVEATEAGAPAPAAPPTGPVFQIRNASLQVPAADGGVVRLVAEVVEYDAVTLRERKQMMIRQRKQEARKLGIEAPPYEAPALQMDFRIGTANANAASAVLEELAKARAAFVRGRPGFGFPAGLGVEFEIADGRAPVTGGMLSAAAGVLLESMSQGVTLADDAGAVGQLGFGSKFQLGETPLSGALNTSEQTARFAVPVTAGADAADMAALGELSALLNVQLLACRDVNHAMQLLGEESNADRDRALELFAEIGHAAKRTPADALVAQPVGESAPRRSARALSRTPVRRHASEGFRSHQPHGIAHRQRAASERTRALDPRAGRPTAHRHNRRFQYQGRALRHLASPTCDPCARATPGNAQLRRRDFPT